MNESALTATPKPAAPAPEPSIVPCNFRSAGRLSNDSIRHLRNLHDTFARNVTHSLDLFLGSPLDIKLIGVEQIESRDFTSSLTAGCYLVPFSLMPVGSRVIAKFDSALLFPLLDVLLGGSGEPMEETRELTEIDEELIRSVTEVMAVQLESVWKPCNVTVTPSASLKPAMMGQLFASEERVVSLHFEMTLGITRAGLRIALPMAFCNALVRSSHTEVTRRTGFEAASKLRLRERVLHCSMDLSAELSGLHISVGELLDLRPGSVLNLRAPVESPVRLSVEHHPLFEITPVRRNGRKTAQLGRPCTPELSH